ncbi:hypothetical protein Micbo1qcDRAFT_41548 [Microdochium bolleyi]|uniref:Uncharacterized protein n=1 Tax=Microdochium bolleyi TaxID=196109 RepID=A0A136JAD7_9PEZI|nr:hypothetical protein Micbo1qcDRAFT_41548 [Microdochium bolleyi]
MGQPSFEASNAIIYVTYGAFLLLGTGLAWRMRNQPKSEFLAGNRTQTGQITSNLSSQPFFEAAVANSSVALRSAWAIYAWL